MEGKNPSNLKVGLSVELIQKQHQKTGELTAGIISKILTNSAHHPHGIKVQLASGSLGRVKKILE
jgi:uncharacterized repeat protein (TIGR03833 family)